MNKAAERDHDTSDLLDVLREREKLEDERRQMMEAMGRLSKERRLFEASHFKLSGPLDANADITSGNDWHLSKSGDEWMSMMCLPNYRLPRLAAPLAAEQYQHSPIVQAPS